jgi:hypothetical protein
MARTDLLTIRDVAELLRVPVSWVYGHTRRRSIDRIPGLPDWEILALSRERSSSLGREATRGAQSCVVEKVGLHWRPT